MSKRKKLKNNNIQDDVKDNSIEKDNITKRVVFVFSCPGQKEAQAGMPCSGRTGKNLDLLLTQLHQKYPCYFSSQKRYDYRIINASTKVHYMKKTGDTEPSEPEIDDSNNIARIEASLHKDDIVICFGEKAKYAIDIVNKNKRIRLRKIILAEHLSFQHLNTTYNKVNGKTPQDRTKKRIKLAEKSIFRFFCKAKMLKKMFCAVVLLIVVLLVLLLVFFIGR